MKNFYKAIVFFSVLLYANTLKSQAVNTLYISNAQDGTVYNISALNGNLPVPVVDYTGSTGDASASNLAVGPNPSNLAQYVFTHSDTSSGAAVYQNTTNLASPLLGATGGLTADPATGIVYGVTSARHILKVYPSRQDLGLVTGDATWNTGTVSNDSFFDNMGNMYIEVTNGASKYIYRVNPTTLTAVRYLTLSGSLPTNFQGLAYYNGKIYAVEAYSTTLILVTWNNARIFEIDPTTGVGSIYTSYALNTYLGPFSATDNIDLASSVPFIAPVSDMGVTKTASTNTPIAGTNIVFTITATNNGTNNNTNVNVTDMLPNGYAYVSSSASTGTYTSGTGVWNIGNLANGASATLSVTAMVNATGSYTNTATITGFNNDNNAANNSASVTPVPTIVDSDGDGVPNYIDLDDDNDGILDTDECALQNLVSNGTFDADYNPEWTNTGYWVYNSAGKYAQNTQDGVPAGIGFLTQLISNIPPATIPLTLTVGAKDGGAAGTADLVIRLGGTIYATIKNSTAATNNVTIQLSNGATSNFTPYTVGTASFVPRTFTIFIPYTGPQSSSLSFEMISGIDDWYIDNVSINVCDTDVDGIPNDLDLDSDGDGCFDAREGDENVVASQLNTNGSINSAVNANGIPILVNPGGAADIGNDIGQGIGQSHDALKNDCLDSDADGFPDWIDLDDDNDGILDTTECPAGVIVQNGTFTAPVTQWTLGAGWFTAGDIAVNQWDDVTSDLSQNLNNLDRTNGTIKLSFTLGAQDGFNSGGNSANLSVIINGTTYATYFNSTVQAIGTNNVTQTLASGVTSTFTAFSTAASSGFTAQNITLTIPYTGPASAPLIFRHNAGLDDWSIDNVSIISYECDADGDGIPNRLDLDSDNDGCLDAVEGGNNLPLSSLVAAGGTVTVGTGSSASNQNLCGGSSCVGSTGIPTIVNQTTGQTLGSSQNSGVKAAVCLVCYNPIINTAAGTNTNHGITLLKRAGADNGNWPMIIKSAHTTLESNTKGFVITRATTAQINLISNPQEGMMVFDTSVKCLKIYADGVWSCFSTPTCP